MVRLISPSMIDGGLEVGDLIWSARSSKNKHLLCQAQAVSRTTYALLFAQIGTTFGDGDGATTFNLPDGRGRALIGTGAAVAGQTSARALGAKGGAETHILSTAEMPNHTHATPQAGLYAGSGYSVIGAGGTGVGQMAAQTTSAGSGAAHNNMPPFLGANLFIYAGV